MAWQNKVFKSGLGLWRRRGGVPALTRDGIEYLQQIIADERAAGRALPQVKLTE